uniref:Janus kinase and microtubule-interacting protein C-terminal domain-containing protein n=1 Tax=Denticeps clupeoides TaxID=299321 RepID=A0AAY4D520_9TELE
MCRNLTIYLPATKVHTSTTAANQQLINPLIQTVGKLRERVQELRSQRDCEQHKHSVALTELRVKLHEERQREVAVAKEALSRQHEAELGRLARVREAELARLQVQVSALRDGGGVNGELRSAIREEGREEARRSHEAEKLRLTQELQEARSSRRQAEEALANALQADKTKAADLRVAHQAHQDEIQRIKRESERDIRRLECVDERDSRRFQLKIAELQAVIRKLEDRNTLLSDERNELLKRVREADGQMKQLLEKNRRMSKKNEDLLQTLQRMEDKLKNLSRENSNPQHAILQRPSSLTDLSHAHEQQEVEFLRLQVTEQRSVIDELVQVCHHERDRLLMNRKNRRKGLKLPKRHVVETYFGFDEESVDSETSSLTSFNTDHTPATPDEEPEESFCREEAELRFRQLTREYQALQRAYALLQETAGPLDPERHCRTREHLQTELTGCQARIADLEKSLAEQGQDAKWVEEKQKLIKSNQELRDEIVILKQNELRLHAEVQDSKDQNELLEFRVLELEWVIQNFFPFFLAFLNGLFHSPFYFQNLRNEEQVTVIQACNVLSMCEKWLKQIDSTEAALTQKMMDLENEKELFSKQKGFLEEELDYRKQALDHAHLELEATLYAVLQQNPDSRQGETLNDRQRAELEEAMESVRRQILRQSRQADSLILQQRMELLHSAQQRIRELEDKIDIQRQQIKEIEEKLLFLFLVFSLAFILWP